MNLFIKLSDETTYMTETEMSQKEITNELNSQRFITLGSYTFATKAIDFIKII